MKRCLISIGVLTCLLLGIHHAAAQQERYANDFAKAARIGTYASSRVVVMYFTATDSTADEVFTQAQLNEQLFSDQTGLKRYFTEVSQGRYSYGGKVIVNQLPITKAEFKPIDPNHNGVMKWLNDRFPDGVPGTYPDLSEYDLPIILVAHGSFSGLSGSWKYSTPNLKFGNQQLPDVSVVNFAIDKKYEDQPFSIYYYPSDKPFKGWGESYHLKVPDLGLKGWHSTLIHEWLHNIGLGTHSWLWTAQNEPLADPTPNYRGKLEGEEYGDPFDPLGRSGKGGGLHPHGLWQYLLGWLTPDELTEIKATQQNVRLIPLEKTGGKRLVQIHPKGQILNERSVDKQWLFVEYRRPIGLDKHLGIDYYKSNTEGLMVRVGMTYALKSTLLDMNPDNVLVQYRGTLRGDAHEVTLNAGQEFYHPQSQITLTNVRPDGDNGITFDVIMGENPNAKPGVHPQSSGG